MMKRYTLFLLATIIVIVVSVAMRNPNSNIVHEGTTNSEKIKFSHTAHITERGVACSTCHSLAMTSKLSSDNLMASHENCQTCHEEQINNECAYCHTTADEIQPIENKEREFTFSHEKHAADKNIPCETCHNGMDSVTYATEENMPTMAMCITCHSKENVSTNCETCHNDFVNLLPDNHRSANFRKEHKGLARIGMLDVQCSVCHNETSCQDCHSGMQLNNFGIGKDMMTEPSAKSMMQVLPNTMRLHQMQDVNYRFTHGIDVKSKLLDCGSCHEQQTFCVGCHQEGGNITQQKFKPASYNVAGFANLPGQGIGGGLHAKLAQRDLESCMSCHDAEGSDPVCAMCHTAEGGN